MLVLILITTATVFLFYYIVVKPYSYWKDRGIKQGNPKWIVGDNGGPLFGTQSFADNIQTIYNRYPEARYSGMYQFLQPLLLIRDPDLIKQITVKDFDHFTDHRTFVPDDVDPLWSKNLVALRGQQWRDMRTILSPSFTSSKMKSMFLLMSECAETFVQHFIKKKVDVITVEFKDIFTRFTNDVIATTAFGIKVDSLDEPNNSFYLMGKDATNFSGFWRNLKIMGYLIAPKLYSILNITFFPKETSKFFTKIVSDTIRVRKEKNIVRPDMINLLLEARRGTQNQEKENVIDTGYSTAQESELKSEVSSKSKSPKELTDLDITAQAMVFFLAGFDSVSSLMCFMGYELAANPDIQDKLREEVKSTLEECDGKLTYEGLLKMKYMDMVVSETLRKWPLSPATDRVVTKPITIAPAAPDEKPLHLEKGTSLFFPIYGLHRDPEHFPDPNRFVPERFSDENKDNIKPYTYFPFGLGPRNCIGSRFALLETKAVFFHILRHFEIVPVERSRIPLQLYKKQFNLTADGGFWFGLKRI